MIRLDRPVIVEGKYDKIALGNVVDALIITTDGFGIFKNREKCALIRRLAQKNGVIIMTDSDSAGAVIRSYLKKIISDSEIINVYVPELRGKEKRKAKPSKSGLIGVEGMKPEIIRAALERSGVFSVKEDNRRKITKTDMYAFGLSGRENSADKRKSFLRLLELPETLSPSAMLDVLNNMLSYEEFLKKAELWTKETDKTEIGK
ncbi:MAG: toprim domain-containing protein [Acutalibacteraceae bacterium]